MVEIISAFIASVGAVIAAYVTVKNKKNIEQWKDDINKNTSRTVNSVATIYGEMWWLLHTLNADRVFIIQPHPLINYLYISIGLEVVRNGVNKLTYSVKDLPMADVSQFISQLAKEDFIYYQDAEQDCSDKRAKAIFSTNGTSQLAIKKLTDLNDNWIGSLCVDTTLDGKLDETIMVRTIAEAANNIQYILPEYSRLPQ